MLFKEIISDNVLFTAFVLYSLCFTIQMIYYWKIFGKFAFYKKNKLPNQYKAVSVIICAKNEYFNLKKNLPLILEQDYPGYEVVVVNDCSEDDSQYLLKIFSEKYSHLKVITIKQNVNFFRGKKFALAVGIKSAKNDILLLTDADCSPKSNRWIAEMQNNFTGETEIVLGYSGYEYEKGILNKMIRFETIMTALQYFSWSLTGKTYMGVGRNLAYNKKLFFDVKGFTSHYHISSGDDDLFINKVATNRNTSIEISKQAHTSSAPKKTFNDWFLQKKRHYSTGFLYKPSHKIMLGMFGLSSFLFYLSLFFILIFSVTAFLYSNIIIVCSLFIIRLATQLIIIKKTMKKLDEKKLLLISPILDFVFVILNPIIAFWNVIVKNNKWK